MATAAAASIKYARRPAINPATSFRIKSIPKV